MFLSAKDIEVILAYDIGREPRLASVNEISPLAPGTATELVVTKSPLNEPVF